MFPCCDVTYQKYLKNEPGNPVSQEHLDRMNEWLTKNGKEPKKVNDLCRCMCHVIGHSVMH